MLRYLSLFSGIGAFEKALTNLGVKYEVVNYCEIDKYASKSYSAIHGVPESKNLWDITKVNVFNLPKDIDLLTYGFPCQDISLAGKQKGMFNEDGTLTRSGLFFKALDVIECVKPKIAIAENVKALTSKKFSEEFKIVLDSLEKAGYHNYWKVLNAKDYGIPQNRERVFIVSIRKDIDHNMFEFPKPYSLEKRLKDFLEPHVDEKYYLSDKMISYISAPNQKWTGNNNGAFINKDIASTLNTGEGSRRCDASNYVSNDLPDNFDLQDTNRIMVVGKSKSGGERSLILDEDGISNCLSATDYKQPKQNLIREKTKKGYAEAQDGDGVYINRPHQKCGVVQKGMIQTIKTSPDIGVVVKDEINVIGNYSPSGHDASRIVHPDGIAPTVKENYGTVTATIVNDEIKPKLVGGIGDKKSNGGTQYYQRDRIYDSESIAMAHPANLPGGSYKYQVNIPPLRIRKLTPKECYRLMGFSDDDFEKSESVPTSNTQLYKQAGNSIVVDVLEEIFCMMLDEEDNLLV